MSEDSQQRSDERAKEILDNMNSSGERQKALHEVLDLCDRTLEHYKNLVNKEPNISEETKYSVAGSLATTFMFKEAIQQLLGEEKK